MDCNLCGRPFTPQRSGNFSYCPICRAKIERGEVDGLHLPDERQRKRNDYFRRVKIRRERYAEVEKRRAQGERICYWCGDPISKRQLKHNSNQKFCCPSHATEDLAEKRNLNGFYFSMSKKGNRKQEEIELETGIRPGTEQRRKHVAQLTEARKQGKPWGKTGPKPRKKYL